MNKVATEIKLYDYIYSSTQKEFENALSTSKGGDITVYINSGGGDVFASVAIHNMLKRHDGKVTIIVDGLAASGASIIAMAGDVIKMHNNSTMMIHNAWTFGAGNADDFEKLASDLRTINEAVVNSYKTKINISDDELKSLLDDEKWLSAESALELGFCNEIIQDENTQDNKVENEEDEEDEEEVETTENSYSTKFMQSDAFVKNILDALGGRKNDESR
ncbi:head maturation protease, ClpP-related [Culicoidibacter larvae]|uniref:ATP-dependent Clp protease proteolytic subunit n=1 Tax=Culicoidibacter larvae TaxID=2579976 RepID=A0A5R8QAC9_9FIRM|nr:head maturation protease, ClpP-related [Culicoidibacter larvae]TLG72056.1 Clp protease ClpP [Culicoidibacter larvae]